MNFYQFVTPRDTQIPMKNVLSHLLTKALNGLKDLTDPARQGSPYDHVITYEMTSPKRRMPFFRKRMMLRV